MSDYTYSPAIISDILLNMGVPSATILLNSTTVSEAITEFNNLEEDYRKLFCVYYQIIKIENLSTVSTEEESSKESTDSITDDDKLYYISEFDESDYTVTELSKFRTNSWDLANTIDTNFSCGLVGFSNNDLKLYLPQNLINNIDWGDVDLSSYLDDVNLSIDDDYTKFISYTSEVTISVSSTSDYTQFLCMYSASYEVSVTSDLPDWIESISFYYNTIGRIYVNEILETGSESRTAEVTISLLNGTTILDSFTLTITQTVYGVVLYYYVDGELYDSDTVEVGATIDLIDESPWCTDFGCTTLISDGAIASEDMSLYTLTPYNCIKYWIKCTSSFECPIALPQKVVYISESSYYKYFIISGSNTLMSSVDGFTWVSTTLTVPVESSGTWGYYPPVYNSTDKYLYAITNTGCSCRSSDGGVTWEYYVIETELLSSAWNSKLSHPFKYDDTIVSIGVYESDNKTYYEAFDMTSTDRTSLYSGSYSVLSEQTDYDNIYPCYDYILSPDINISDLACHIIGTFEISIAVKYRTNSTSGEPEISFTIQKDSNSYNWVDTTSKLGGIQYNSELTGSLKNYKYSQSTLSTATDSIALFTPSATYRQTQYTITNDDNYVGVDYVRISGGLLGIGFIDSGSSSSLDFRFIFIRETASLTREVTASSIFSTYEYDCDLEYSDYYGGWIRKDPCLFSKLYVSDDGNGNEVVYVQFIDGTHCIKVSDLLDISTGEFIDGFEDSFNNLTLSGNNSTNIIVGGLHILNNRMFGFDNSGNLYIASAGIS